MNVISYAPSTPEDRIRRRRSLFNDYTRRREAREAVSAAPEPAVVAEAVLWDERAHAVTEPETLKKVLRKGTCEVCGKFIGRGVGLHRKRCEG